jgi:BTB/POZ domain
MTTTPPSSDDSRRSHSPKIVYSNFPTTDHYRSPYAPHAVWWLDNADIFLSIRGIVYGLRQIHFIQSPIFRHLLAHTKSPFNTPFGTTPEAPISFDKIRPSMFEEMIYLLHLSETFKTTKENWLQIYQIAKDWGMPHVARRATTEMDRIYFQNHPYHLRRWDMNLYRQIQERERRLLSEWIVRYQDCTSEEDSDDEETIFDLYSTTERIISDDSA